MQLFVPSTKERVRRQVLLLGALSRWGLLARLQTWSPLIAFTYYSNSEYATVCSMFVCNAIGGTTPHPPPVTLSPPKMDPTLGTFRGTSIAAQQAR